MPLLIIPGFYLGKLAFPEDAWEAELALGRKAAQVVAV